MTNFVWLLLALLIAHATAQFFQATAGVRIATEQSQVINMAITNDTLIMTPQASTQVFTLTGPSGAFQNYALFASNGSFQQGNTTFEVDFGAVLYFYEAQLATYIPITGGILSLFQYDVLTDSEGQVVAELTLLDENDQNFNGPVNFVFNFTTHMVQMNGRRRATQQFKPTDAGTRAFNNLLHSLQHGGKHPDNNPADRGRGRLKSRHETMAKISGGFAHDRLMMQYAYDMVMSELSQPASRRRGFTDYEELVPTQLIAGTDNLGRFDGKVYLPEEDKDFIGEHRRLDNYHKKAFRESSFRKGARPFNIPQKLIRYVIDTMRPRFADYAKTGDRKRAIGGGIKGSQNTDSAFFDALDVESCNALQNGHGFLTTVTTNCLFSAIEYVASGLVDVNIRVNALINTTDLLIQAQNMTAQAIATLNDIVSLQQDQIDLIKNQINNVYSELNQLGFQINSQAIALTLSSESQLLLANTVLLLDGQIARANWINDQNFKQTQAAFNGISATIQQQVDVMNTGIIHLQEQQAIIDATQNKVFFTQMTYVFVTLNNLIRELRMEMNILINALQEQNFEVAEQTLDYVALVTSSVSDMESVLTNLFPIVQDLQRLNLGNTQLAMSYYLNKDMIVTTPPVSDALGFQMIAIPGTGRPTTPINKEMTRDGWEFNATILDISANCIFNAISSATLATQMHMATVGMMNVMMPRSINPIYLHPSYTISAVPIDGNFEFMGLVSNISDNNQYYFALQSFDEFPIRNRLLMINTSAPGGLTSPNALVAAIDSPTYRGCNFLNYLTCGGGGLYSLIFFLPQWRTVPFSENDNVIIEQQVTAFFYEQDAITYYLDITPGGQMRLTTYSGNVDNMWVFNNFPLNINQNFANEYPVAQGSFVALTPFDPFQDLQFFNLTYNASLYPVPGTQRLWEPNVTVYVNTPTGYLNFSVANLTSGNYPLIYYTLNSQFMDQIERNATIELLIAYYNNGTIPGSRRRGLKDLGKPKLMRVGDLLVPEDYQSKLPKFDPPPEHTHAPKRQPKRALVPANFPSPAEMDECWGGIGSVNGAKLNFNSLTTYLNTNPLGVNNLPTAAQAKQCIQKPGCMLYQMITPTVLNLQLTNISDGFDLTYQVIPDESNVIQAETNFNTNGQTITWYVWPPGYDLLDWQYNGNGALPYYPPPQNVDLNLLCATGIPINSNIHCTTPRPGINCFGTNNASVNLTNVFFRDTPRVVAAQCYYGGGGGLVWLGLTPSLGNRFSNPYTEVSLVCAPFDSNLISDYNPNAVYRNPAFPTASNINPWQFDNSSLYYSSMLNTSIYIAPSCKQPCTPMPITFQVGAPNEYDFSDYGAQVVISWADCSVYDYVGCASPTLGGLCVQSLLVNESTATPGGPLMAPGCVYVEDALNCSTFNYSQCIYTTYVSNSSGLSVPYCTWVFTSWSKSNLAGTCRPYNPITDPIALITQLPNQAATIGVNCALRTTDQFSCTFDGYCMFMNVLGSTSFISASTQCLPLGTNAPNAPFYNISFMNPTLYSLTSLAPFGITNTTIAQCTDPAVYCSVTVPLTNDVDSGSKNMNWIFQNLTSNPQITCAQLSISLGTTGSCIDRLFYLQYGGTYVPQCRLADTQQCQQNCLNFQQDLNTCLQYDYCLIKQSTAACFNYDDRLAQCTATYAKSPTVLGSPCIGVLNVCTLLEADLTMQNTAITSTGGPPPFYINGYSRAILATSECITLAGYFTGNISTNLTGSRLGPAGLNVYSLPQQLSNSCVAYIKTVTNLICYPANLFPSLDSDIVSFHDADDSSDYATTTLQSQQCLFGNVYDCLAATQFGTLDPYALACAWTTSGLDTLGQCVKLTELGRLSGIYGSYMTIYNLEGWMRTHADVAQNITLTPMEFIALGLSINSNLYIPGTADRFNTLANQAVLLGPLDFPCPEGLFQVGPNCCENPTCYTADGSTYEYNMDAVRWFFLNYLQSSCLSGPLGNWSEATTSSIHIVCNEQFSYSSIAYDPENPLLASAQAALLNALNRNITLPLQTTYACQPFMAPYLAPMVFPFADTVPDQTVYLMDSFGNLTSVTLTPLQEYPSAAPQFNGTFLFATNPVYRPLRKVVLAGSSATYGTSYEFDFLTSFSASDISFANNLMDMSTLVEEVTPGQLMSNGVIVQSGWTVTDFVATALQGNISQNIQTWMTSSTSIYGENPQVWGAREEFGVFISRTYGGSSPNGDPVTKTDQLIAVYISNKLIPVWTITNVQTAFTAQLVATNADGQETTLFPTSVVVSNPNVNNLLAVGDLFAYFVGDDLGSKIYAAQGPLLIPYTPYGPARVASDTQTFNVLTYLNAININDPNLVQFIDQYQSNSLAGACDADPTSPACLCGDALPSGLNNFPTGEGVTDYQTTYILQTLNEPLLSVTPEPNMPPVDNVTFTLWDYWVAQMDRYGVGAVISVLETFQQIWNDVGCINELADFIYIYADNNTDFLQLIWKGYVTPVTLRIDLIALTSYFATISATGNWYTCGNCILYGNGTYGVYPMPTLVNGTVPYGVCDPRLGVTLAPQVAPLWQVDVVKTSQNYPCSISSSFQTYFEPLADNATTWAFSQLTRPGTATIQLVFNGPNPGAIWALSSNQLCPFVTNGSDYSATTSGAITYLTNPYPFALTFYLRTRFNASSLQANESVQTPCEYDKILSVQANSTNSPFTVPTCSGTSFFQIWNTFNAFNCSPVFQVDLLHSVDYGPETRAATTAVTYYQSALLQNQLAFDDSVSRLNAEFASEISITRNQLVIFNNTFLANITSLQQAEIGLQNLTTNLNKTVAANQIAIGQIQIGFMNISNEFTNVTNNVNIINATVEAQKEITMNLQDELEADILERNQQAANFTREINALSAEIVVLQAEVDQLVKNITALVNAAAANLPEFQSFANFAKTGAGQAIQTQMVDTWVAEGVLGLFVIIFGAISIAALVISIQNKKGMEEAGLTGNKKGGGGGTMTYAPPPSQPPPQMGYVPNPGYNMGSTASTSNYAGYTSLSQQSSVFL